jgi:hypothetical protein
MKGYDSVQHRTVLRLTMRMNGDQKGQAGKMGCCSSGSVAPAPYRALCAALGGFYYVGH